MRKIHSWAVIRTWRCWVESKNATSVQHSPPGWNKLNNHRMSKKTHCLSLRASKSFYQHFSLTIIPTTPGQRSPVTVLHKNILRKHLCVCFNWKHVCLQPYLMTDAMLWLSLTVHRAKSVCFNGWTYLAWKLKHFVEKLQLQPQFGTYTSTRAQVEPY